MEERIQKILARAGYGSRRACEELIIAGRVRVNDRIAQLGEKADAARDQIRLDGQTIAAPEAPVYIALYKPRGVLTTAEAPDPRPTVIDLVETSARVYPVGRLDVDSEGLVLLTNDGEMANRLTHPRYGHEKEYKVLVASRPDDEQLETWRRGVVLEDGYKTTPAQVRVESPFGKGTWLRVILREGRKRQIREVGSRLGLTVVRILRIRMGAVYLGSLKPREWRFLTRDEIAALSGQPGQTTARPRKPGTRPAGAGSKPKRPSAGGHHPESRRLPTGGRPSAGGRPPAGGRSRR
jgi:23S rRNA pseudouridine2605 synthase